ncbi:hypothetical protein FKW77_000539 [Venturia effusa]|uniref:Carboxylic ester hydrolase n=1 Tax=Venturia effusa TaxID=50376 RepID=A0A517L6J6_9PEZI|nr:hypothetical protein FKW77_000539 [Venturia effusa]
MHLILFLVLLPVSLALPSFEDNGLHYHSLTARAQSLPSLKLPYGTWQASRYDSANDIYVFKNIRFAAAPVGPLRFAKPAPPVPTDKLQTGAHGGTCAQSAPTGLLTGALGSGLGSIASGIVGSVDLGKVMGGAATSEDCLFLDLYVPSNALKGEVKLPIINWVYGGAYILGSKDGMYDGTGIVKNSGSNVIYVAGNYRLGSFGFLSGSTVEKEGTPNAGFWDQRAVLQWIHEYAPLFGGDENDVSLWGESAGGGSIMHQLTAFGGNQPALFKKAVVESAAYDVWVDRKNDLEKKFQDLLKVAGCSGKGLECLRALDFTAMREAQDKYISTLPEGKFGFGPATDGNFVRQLPALEFASGNFDKNVESLILSHVSDEAGMFIKDPGNNETVFQTLLDYNWGKNDLVNEAMLKHYPAKSEKWKTQKERFHDFVQTTVFTCNVRYMTEAYKGKTYNIQYARGAGTHGSDISPTFFTSPGVFGGQSAKISQQYQSYLISHARTGDPNRLKTNGLIEWPKVEWGPSLKQVLNVTDLGFTLITDDKTTAEDCDLWKDVMAALTVGGGYSPPGAVVESALLTGKPDVMAKASANFQ